MFKFKVRKLFQKSFGLGTTATLSRPKPRLTFRPRLEALDERYCPSTTWSPQLIGGSYDTNGNNPANYTNGLPSASNPLILDGSQTGSNQPITFSSALDIGSLTVQNNYNNTLTIKSGATLNTETSDAVNTGCTLTIVSADSTGIDLFDSGSNFSVQSGATIKLTDPAGATSGGTYLSAAANNAGAVLNNSGTVSWTGTAVASPNPAIEDTINVAVYNAGTFNADGGTKGNNTEVGGLLEVAGSDALTNNVGFDMVSGSVNLTNVATLWAEDNYYQSAGSLTSDSSTVTLQTGTPLSLGDINIAGGSVTVDNVANTVGKLIFKASTVEINGQINVNGLSTGGNSTQADKLVCGSAKVTLGTHSYLNVGTTGTGTLGTGNQWTVMTYGSYQNTWGGINVPPGMTPNVMGISITVTGPSP